MLETTYKMQNYENIFFCRLRDKEKSNNKKKFK